MEHSYYQKEHSSKWNTHQNGILILSKGTSSKWNTPIIKRNTGDVKWALQSSFYLAIPCNRLSSSLLRFVPYVLFSGQMDDPSMVSIKNIFNNINLPFFFDSRITPVAPVGLWTFLRGLTSP